MKKPRPRTVVLAVFIVGLVGAALAWLVPRWLNPSPPFQQMVKMRVVYSVPGMERADVQRDLVYAVHDGTSLKADVYTPPNLAAGARVPAVLLVHGGPIEPEMRPKDWGVYVSYGQLLAASGLAAVAFNHRYFGANEDGLMAASGDVEALMRYVREHRDALHVDDARLAVWAFSGGGLFLSVPMRQATPFVRCLVSYYGLLDVPDDAGAAAKAFTPMSQLEQAHALPPFLIAQAGRDSPWINSSVDRFVSRAKAKGFEVTVLEHPKGHHAFDVIDADEQSRAAIKSTIRFLQLQLGVAR